jgi:hypothetical protein
MTKVTLPASLATAIQAAEELEARIGRTRSALATATDRAERAPSELAQAEIERDALAAARDLALAAVQMGEQPEQDPATIEKQIASFTKRVTAARAEKETATGAERGLRLRLSRELAERPAVLRAIQAGQADARIALKEAGTAIFDKIADLIVSNLGPIARAEAAIGGESVNTQVARLILDDLGPHHPTRHLAVKEAVRTAPVPAEFQHAGVIAQRLARTVEHEA